MTFWEQIDDGVQFTPTRKFLTVVPVALFLLASHGTDYRRQPLGVNLAVVVSPACPPARLPAAPCISAASASTVTHLPLARSPTYTKVHSILSPAPVAWLPDAEAASPQSSKANGIPELFRVPPPAPCPRLPQVVLLIAKLASMHKVRIFGINRD